MNSSDEELPKKSSKSLSGSLKFDRNSPAKPSILKNSSSSRRNDSDDEKQDEYRRYNSPINSSRSISSKPPTGRLPTLNESSRSSTKKVTSKSNFDSDEEEKTNYTSVVSSSSRKFTTKKSESDEEENDKKLNSRYSNTNGNKKYSTIKEDYSDEDLMKKTSSKTTYKSSKKSDSEEEKFSKKFDNKKAIQSDDEDDTNYKKKALSDKRNTKYNDSDDDEKLPTSNKKTSAYNLKYDNSKKSDDEEISLSSRMQKKSQLDSLKRFTKPESPRPKSSRYDNSDDEDKYKKKSTVNSSSTKKILNSDDEDDVMSGRLKKVSESPRQTTKAFKYDLSDEEKYGKKNGSPKPVRSKYDFPDDDKLLKKSTTVKKTLKSEDEDEFDLKKKSFSDRYKFESNKKLDDEKEKKFSTKSSFKKQSDSDEDLKNLKKTLESLDDYPKKSYTKTEEPKKEDWKAAMRKNLNNYNFDLDSLRPSDKLRKSPDNLSKKTELKRIDDKKYNLKSDDDDDVLIDNAKKSNTDRYKLEMKKLEMDDDFKKPLSNRLTKTSNEFETKKNFFDDDFSRRYDEYKTKIDPLSRTAPTNSLSAYNSVNNLTKIPEKTTSITRYNSASNLSDTVPKNLKVKDAKNRSFLVGSISSKGLLGSQELDRVLIDRKARVLVATWNMGGIKTCPDKLEELLLPDNIETLPDIFAIGTQEFDLNRKEWEVKLQELIGPSHVKLASHYYGALGINIFIRRDLIWFCSVVDSEEIGLRKVFTPMSTKGSVLISFQLFGTLVCFICSHFVSDDENADERIENYKSTVTSINLPKSIELKNRKPIDGANDLTENFDCVYWFGDFNSRSKKDREKVIKKIEDVKARNSTDFEEVLNHDELQLNIRNNKQFKNFLEPRIRFAPTYKFDVNTDNYDTSEKCRIPSYCDRILYRTKQKNAVSCSIYDSVKELKHSDHRAVYSLFDMTIRPGIDKVPLSFGEFDREIYIAGYRKRQMYRALDIGFGSTISTDNSKLDLKQNSKKSRCPIQ